MKIKSILPLFLVLLLSCSQNNENPPNIILIMADDLGYGDIGCFGSDFIKTPILDKMATEGMTFTDYHSNGAVCTPTRAALMTGNYQQRAGLEGVIYAALDKREEGLADSEKTLPEYLKDIGYVNGAFGKWHLGYKPEYNPTYHGFDEFYGYVSGNVDFISHRDGSGLYDWWQNRDTSYEKGYVTDLITDHALAFIEKNRNKPFFVYLPHEAPHFPYQGRNDKADRLPGVKFPAHGSRPDKKQAYKEMVEIMDENIGRVFQTLKKLDLDENTFVLFCSDNGATKLGSNGTLNGFKGSLWEGGHRVPAIAWYPNEIKAGSTTDATVLSMDILPTLLSIAKVENLPDLDGKDFSDFLFSEEVKRERPVFWRYRNQWVARKDNWKYMRIKDQDYLFDLSEDLSEKNNHIDRNPGKAEELIQLLKEWEREMGKYELKTD